MEPLIDQGHNTKITEPRKTICQNNCYCFLSRPDQVLYLCQVKDLAKALMQNYSDIITIALTQYQADLGIKITPHALIQIDPIGHGENNHIFKVTIGSNQLVFRIPFRLELAPKLKQEFLTLKNIPTNIGPEALLFHEGDPTYMIQSLIPGIHITDWTIKLIHKHVDTMVRLHSSSTMDCNGIDIISLFEAKIDFRYKNDPEVMQDKSILGLTQKLLQQLKTIQTIFSNVKILSFIHGDLHPGNILVDAENIHYVDWEEARYDDYALDVAGLLLSQSINTELYFAAYQKAAIPDPSLGIRVITWLLYKDLSFLLHKKWESLNPACRTIHQSEQDYQTIITQIVERMHNRLSLL